jgi:hypothetical protein
MIIAHHILLLAVILMWGTASAQTPTILSYQGYLETGGAPVDGSAAIVIRLYPQQSGGNAAWSQSFPAVTVNKGVYTLTLDVSTLPFDKPYWVETEVNGAVSSARTALTSVPYSLGPWSIGSGVQAEPKNGNNAVPSAAASAQAIYYSNGNVGIGTSSPACAFDLQSGGGDMFHMTGYEPFLTLYDNNHSNARTAIQSVNGGMNFFSSSYLSGADPFAYASLTNTGRFGIGTANPTAKLEVASGSGDIFRLIGYEPFMTLYDANSGYSRGAIQQVNGGLNFFTDSYLAGVNLAAYIRLDNSGNVGLGTATPTAKLEVLGHTKTQVLEITGGGDFSENFDISQNSSGSIDPLPGMIVSIDPDHPGELTVSSEPYDARVAGIISGAGGISPGMVMGQKGSIVNGKYPVALTGRVYCWADASTNPIVPGDLLTTSPVAGHAMKAADRSKSGGAVIGKAMTGLQQGTGLVLVLVNIQ